MEGWLRGRRERFNSAGSAFTNDCFSVNRRDANGMKKLKVVPFKKDHLSTLQLRGFELDQLEYIQKYANIYEQGIGYSAFDDDKLILCGGVLFPCNGVGEVWTICDICVKYYVRELYFYVNLYLNRMIERYKLHRVQAHVLVSYKAGQRFLKRMGFKKEGLLKKYDWNKEDYFLYTRIE